MVDSITFIVENTSKEYDSFSDFGFLIKDFVLEEAIVKEEIIDIPCSSNYLDFSRSLTDDEKYERRNINIVLNKKRGDIFLQEYSIIQNALHGKRCKIIHSKDPNFYWLGTVKIGSFEPHKIISEIPVICNVEPYKYEINSSDEDWLWDPFDFETGIINETKNLLVDGILNYTILGRRKKVVPKFFCDNPLQLTFKGFTYNLPSGTCYIPDVEIEDGENLFKFIGNGTVTIEYRGGSL